MKTFLKVCLIIILITLLGFESYFYFFKDKDIIGSISNPNKDEEKVDTKNLVDIYSGYNLDNVTKKTVKEKRATYEIINGLKDEEIENKVNNKIKEKVKTLESELKDKEYLNGKIISNFENTISILFATSDEETEIDFYGVGSKTSSNYEKFADSLNIDLTTGEEITIKDVVNKLSALTVAASKYGYDDLHRIKGIVCGGGPCENPEPDYSTVEDELFTLINKIKEEDFKFIYNPKSIKLHFENVSIVEPIGCNEGTKGCKKYDYFSIDQNHRATSYILKIPMKSLIDNLLIYNKFKTDESIYKKPSTKIDMKFKIPDSYNYQSRMIESNTSLIDYNIPSFILESEKVYNIVREKAIKEVTKVKTNKFTIYNMLGNTDFAGKYDYCYFDVRNYSLDKDVYKKYRKRLYLDKFEYEVSEDGQPVYKTYKDNGKDELGYEYLKKYLVHKYYYYYIIDKKGNEVYEKDILNKDYLIEQIPEEWLSLGKYKTYDDLINNALIIMKPGYNYPNNLVIYVEKYGGKMILKYKNREKNLITSDDTYLYEIEEKLYK